MGKKEHKIIGESIEAREIFADGSVSDPVDAPGIARRGMDQIGGAIEAAGIKLVIPDDISELTKLTDEPPKEI